MIHITRAKNKEFMQATVGDNHKLLSQSQTEKRKSSIWKNIFAEAEQYSSDGDFFVQDDTVKGTPVVYRCALTQNTRYPNEHEPTPDVPPVPRYVAGKNPKRSARPVKK